ncbi:MAG: iron ABC transporter permease [Clostridiales bacterium]|nr:iron ABC transporter permease [Clostridiales bacterium]
MERPGVDRDKKRRVRRLALYGAPVPLVFALCVCVGSVNIGLGQTIRALFGLLEAASPDSLIIRTVRLPRVLCVALVGAALSLSGCAMQGLLRNPLADGSTLGVSAGAALGAVLAIALGRTGMGGAVVMAVLFAFGSLLVILALSFALDGSLATNTIILVGVIFSMFASALMSLVIAFAGEHVRTITFWTMGSLAGTGYGHALLLAGALLPCAGIILCLGRELNAFAVGEENARHVGVDVKRVKLLVMVCVSALIGVCVSVGGTIGFVGLVIPHMTRMLSGPDHKVLLPASMTVGAVFLMLADLTARILVKPLELPIGVLTSLVGAVAFVLIFYRSRRGAAGHEYVGY